MFINFNDMWYNKKTIFRAVCLLLMFSGSANAQPSFSSYDTIPSRYRGYHYTEWYDECPAYKNGGIVDSCNYVDYRIARCNNIVKYEYTDHPINIKGLAVMVAQTTFGNEPYLDSSMAENYLYLLKKMDSIDTINPGGVYESHMYRMKVIDSLRFDTVKPKIMAINQANKMFEDKYVYVYETYFENPITVDSEFYIYASSCCRPIHDDVPPYYMHYDNWHFNIAFVNPIAIPNGCYNNPVLCPPQGQFHSLSYVGYVDLTMIGYPAITDLWCENFPTCYYDDPFGMYFAIVDHYELLLYSDSTEMGSVEGAGYYDENATAECVAIPNPGYAFSHWNDGNTQNPRYLQLTQDTALTAFFVNTDNMFVQVISNNPQWGTVSGEGEYLANSVVTITATPTSDEYVFLHWNDGNTSNTRTFTLTQDTSFTAYFSEAERNYVHLSTNNPLWGSVDGEGLYINNSNVTISATPANDNYAFERWNDGDRQNPRSFIITQDTTFIAHFAQILKVDDATDIPGLNIFPNPTNNTLSVNVSISNNYSYQLLDINGRSVLKGTFEGTNTNIDISTLHAGQYLLFINTTDATSFRTIVKIAQ